jgi:hypothetical protein
MGSPERKQRQRSHVLHMLFLLALAIMVITLPLGVLPKLHGMQAHVGQPQFTSTHMDSAAAAAAGWLSSHEPEWPSLKTQGWPLQYHSGNSVFGIDSPQVYMLILEESLFHSRVEFCSVVPVLCPV